MPSSQQEQHLRVMPVARPLHAGPSLVPPVSSDLTCKQRGSALKKRSGDPPQNQVLPRGKSGQGGWTQNSSGGGGPHDCHSTLRLSPTPSAPSFPSADSPPSPGTARVLRTRSTSRFQRPTLQLRKTLHTGKLASTRQQAGLGAGHSSSWK